MTSPSFSSLLRCLFVSAFLFAGWFTAPATLTAGLEPDPTLTVGELENGLTYAILPNTEPQNRVSLRLYVKAGSLQEREDQRGLAHFLEHMAFLGTEHFEPGTLVEYFQNLGMAFGPDTNAYTSFDRTVYMLELPDTETSSIDEGFLVLSDFAGRMLIEEEQVERERGVILAEKRDRDSVGFRTALEEYAHLLPESIIPERFPIGAEEVIREADREALHDFYAAWYRPNRMAVIVVGEVEPEDVRPLVEKHFGELAPMKPEVEESDLGKVAPLGVAAKLHAEEEAPATRVTIQTVQPYEPEDDTPETRIARMKRSLAMQILNRRLDELAREEDAPFSRGAVAAYDVFDFFTGAAVELTGEPEDWAEALAVAEQELRRALIHGFNEAELREVAAVNLNSLREAVHRAPTRRSPELAEALLTSIHRDTVFTTPEAELELFEPVLEALTPEEVTAAFREVWDNDDRLIFITGNLEIPEYEERILEVYSESMSVAVQPPDEAEVLEFAYTDFGEAGEIVEKSTVEDLQVTQVVFANNVRLNLKRTDFEANAIRVGARIGAGRLTLEPDRSGLIQLAGAAFTEGGLGEHSQSELRRILAGRNVGAQFSAGHDAFQLEGMTTPEDLQLQLQLMAAYVVDPGYRPEALRQARRSFTEMYRQARFTAEGTFRNEVALFLAGGDYRFGLPPEEHIMELDLDDLREWLEKPLREDYLEITLVGDLDKEEAISAVASTFGALPERTPEKPAYEEQRRIRFPKEADEKRFTFTSQIPRGIAAVYWPTDDVWDIRQSRRLSMASEVISDRLRRKVREEMGEAYSPYSSSQTHDTYTGYGLLFALVMVDPDQAVSMAEAIESIVSELYEEGVGEDELERLKRPMLTRLRDTVRDNRYWMNSVLASAQEYPQRLEWARHMRDDYEAITADEVNEVIHTYLSPDNGVRVLVLPEVGEVPEP